MSDDEFDLDFVSNASKKVHDNWNKSIETSTKPMVFRGGSKTEVVPEELSPSPVKKSKEDKENQKESNSRRNLSVSLTPPSSPCVGGRTPRSARGANRTKKTQQALNKILSNNKNSKGAANTSMNQTDVSLILSDDEEEDKLELKVRWKAHIIRVETKQDEKMGKVADRLAEKVGLGVGDVNLYLNEDSIARDRTVSDLGLSVVSVLKARARVAQGQKEEVGDKLEIKLQTKDRRAQVLLEIRPTDSMASVVERFCQKSNTPREKLKFFFDGEVLNEEETAEDLELEGGECIDVHILS